nr:uncharacterized protein LOC127310442 [Lolium perenne]
MCCLQGSDLNHNHATGKELRTVEAQEQAAAAAATSAQLGSAAPGRSRNPQADGTWRSPRRRGACPPRCGGGGTPELQEETRQPSTYRFVQGDCHRRVPKEATRIGLCREVAAVDYAQGGEDAPARNASEKANDAMVGETALCTRIGAANECAVDGGGHAATTSAAEITNVAAEATSAAARVAVARVSRQQDGPEPVHEDGSSFQFLPPAPVVLFCKGSPPLKKVVMQNQPIPPKSAPKSAASSGPTAPRASIKARKAVRKVSARKTLKRQSPIPSQESLHARARFPRIDSDRRGPCRKRPLDKYDPDPVIHWLDLRMGRTPSSRLGKSPPEPADTPSASNNPQIHEHEPPLQAEVGDEFLDKLMAEGQKSDPPAAGAGPSHAPSGKRPRTEVIGGKQVFPVPAFLDDSSGALSEDDRVQRMKDRITQLEKDLPAAPMLWLLSSRRKARLQLT